jgi:phage tail sheath protein FI
VDVGNTVRRFADRNLDTSFAAAYFPDLRLRDLNTSEEMTVPPTVGVLGAFSLNDSIGHPWFAPAGFTRGALKEVIELSVELNQDNLDDLYDTDINPINKYAGSENAMVWGQKTLLKVQSSLDRVNVRRLLIDIRRKVKKIADRILFEPNRASTLARFSAQVNPILSQIQQQQGLDRFKVQIDTTTTTQVDIENNIIRGQILLQPTRSVEFIALDFVVTNTIDENAL